MQPSEVIETYIADTVRLLPSRLREDVANELRSLLNEELQARAQAAGQLADESMVLSMVRAYGTPNEVAARYQLPWAIIDPADSTSFMRAAIIGASALVLLSALSKLRPSPPGTSENLLKVGILAWLGLLVVFFGTRNWVRHRWPAKACWKPRDRDRANRIGTVLVVPVATFVIVLYAAPGWVLDQISGGRLDTSWAVFTLDFQLLRLPFFIGLMASLVVLLAVVAIQGRWRRLTRRIEIALNLALACLILHLAINGNIFQSNKVDQIAQDVLALVAVGYIPLLGFLIYREIGRIDRPAHA